MQTLALPPSNAVFVIWYLWRNVSHFKLNCKSNVTTPRWKMFADDIKLMQWNSKSNSFVPARRNSIYSADVHHSFRVFVDFMQHSGCFRLREVAYRLEKGLKLHFFTPFHKLWAFQLHASSNQTVVDSVSNRRWEVMRLFEVEDFFWNLAWCRCTQLFKAVFHR